MARNRDYDDGDFDQPKRSSPYQDMDGDEYDDDYADDYADDYEDEYAASSVKKGARKGGGSAGGTVKNPRRRDCAAGRDFDCAGCRARGHHQQAETRTTA